MSKQKQCVITKCSQHFLSLEFSCTEFVIHISINNLLSYCGLVDTRITASEKDLPVKKTDVCLLAFLSFCSQKI